jgi:acetylornithine deacetylase
VIDCSALDAAITDGAERAFGFLERLVAAPSTVGHEAEALQVFADELDDLGFRVQRIPVSSDVESDRRAGVSPQVGGERFQIAGSMGPTEGRSLLLNGHIDVVPADTPSMWTSPPFVPRRDGHLLFGRGAGDMKCGFAMGVLALRALLEVDPNAIAGPLTFLAVIEEECSGNGALSAARDGILADAALLLEPTDLELLVGGMGVLWCDVTVEGISAHAEAAHNATNPVDLLMRLVAGLREWAEGLQRTHPDPDMPEVSSPYNLNLGEIHAGDWPSSVPATATMRLRIGFPRAWTPDEAEEKVRAAITAIVERDGGFPSAPHVRPSGFRAAGYYLDPEAEVAVALADAHEHAHGTRPRAYSLGSTTDARWYVNEFDVPAICFGPIARNIHGIDEHVDLESIVAGARTLARFIANWYQPGSLVAGAPS